MIGFVVLALLIAVGFWLFSQSRRRSSWRSPEHQLARMLGADAAERLIRFEQDREPGLSRARAAQKALERAEYDRGR